MVGRFKAYCNSAAPKRLPVLLPLVHTTDTHRFRSILETQKLQPNARSKHAGIYLFYGRPAYRLRDDRAHRSCAYSPVGIVLSSTDTGLSRPSAIYPFDTGAFGRGAYQDHLHEDMHVDSFHLGEDLDAARKLIAIFFGTNIHYYCGEPKAGLIIDPLETEVQSYYNIITSKGASHFDDRRYTVEVQYQSSLTLGHDLKVLAVVLPRRAIESRSLHRTLRDKWGAKLLIYNTYEASKAADWIGTIWARVGDFYRERNLL